MIKLISHNFIYLQYTSVLPYINPFSFDGDANSGDNVQLMCHVAKGDMPIKINWLFNGLEVKSPLGVVTQKLGDRSNFLSVPSVQAENNGSYTCMAMNSAGSFNHTAYLFVKGICYRKKTFNYNIICCFLPPFYEKSLPNSFPLRSAMRRPTREIVKQFSAWR